ncbi:MAG: cation-translocating P-type ATPase [Syntrophaceae bacterium]|nr:cation-translocating P-type ATPase [Syntrophaceae bacterium]
MKSHTGEKIEMNPAEKLDNPSIMAAENLAKILDTDLEKGLPSLEASRRLMQDGPNELRSAPRLPAWRRFLTQFQDPLIYLLLVAITISLIAWMIEGRDGWPIDAIVIALIIIVNALLGYVQENKAEKAVAALSRMTAVTSSVIRDGEVMRIPSAELVCGDLLVLGEGDAVGADGRLFEAASLHVQEASLTGESEPVVKDPVTLHELTALGDRLNMVFKGTAVVQGSGRAMITATGMGTQMGAIAEMLEATQEEPTPLQKEVGRIGRMLAIAIVIIAAVVVATVLLVFEVRTVAAVISVLLLGVSLAVAAVPEGLPAILSVVLAMGVQRMAKHNAIVKKLSSVETLGSASVIASDKTGTLTRSEMTIERVMTASGCTRITGVGYEPQGHVEHEGSALKDGVLHTENRVVLSGGSLAGNAYLRQAEDGRWQIQGDPTEAAFLVAERKLGVHEQREQRFERIGEIPFTSRRKMMSTINVDHACDDQFVLFAKGAPEVLLKRCTRIRRGTDTVPLNDALTKRIMDDVDRLSDDALRTLSVAYRPLGPDEDPYAGEILEQDLIFAGTVGIIDPPREEAKPAVQDAHRAGIRIIMITGDHPHTATRIASELGILERGPGAVTGLELDEMDEATFADTVRKSSVYARVAPEHKLRIVDALQADGKIVAMTGDGVNDAPALKSADIGIAMGITGTEVTKEAAKMILSDDNFATIVAAVREGRGIFDNIRKCLRYLLSSNMGEVLTVFLGVVLAAVLGLSDGDNTLVLPLLATQILWINLITDSGPALAMGIDPETDDVMARKPRRRTDRVIDGHMWAGVVWIGLVMAVVTLITIDMYLPGGLIEGTGSLVTARTAGFTVLVLAQLFNCLNARSEHKSAFHYLFVNPWLWSAIAISGLLHILVVQIGFLNRAFSTAPLTIDQWLTCLAMASIVLWFSELRKLVNRSLNRVRLAKQVSH